MTPRTPACRRRRFAVAVSLLLLIGALAPAVFPPTGPLTGPHPAAHPTARVLAPTSLAGFPALPAHPGAVHPSSTHVDPFAYLTSEPAPMGIADFGVTGVTGDVRAYSYDTRVFQGNVRVDSLLTSGGGGSSMTFQLNTVLVLSHGGTNYSYWIQNIAGIDSSSKGISWVDNIWNLSSPTAALATGELLGNGTVNNFPGVSWYYDVPSPLYPGSQVTLSYPANVSIRSIVSTVNGFPQVGFTYNDGYGWVTYDNVTFAHAQGWTDFGFVVDGYEYTPLGVFYDAEWDYSGGGSGWHNVRSNLSMSLEYWNGHNYESTPNAFNFGGDTAESVDNVVSALGAAPSNGSLYSRVTDGPGSLGLLYNASEVGTLDVWSPSLPVGSVRLNGSTFPYRGGQSEFTVAPGVYEVDVYNGSTLVDSTNVTLGAGATVHVTLPFLRQPIAFQEFGLPDGTNWSITVGSST
ncbi:MAG TPA: thermopsin family protease, partial [Thermoplasmata archaeon]